MKAKLAIRLIAGTDILLVVMLGRQNFELRRQVRLQPMEVCNFGLCYHYSLSIYLQSLHL